MLTHKILLLISIVAVITICFTSALSSSSSSSKTTILKQAKSDNIQAAVLVPGFLTGANEFKELCQTLTDGGLPTIAVPMPNWHWIPCLVRTHKLIHTLQKCVCVCDV